MRIVAEWKDYDNEIKRLQIKQSKHEDEVFKDEIQSKGNFGIFKNKDNFECFYSLIVIHMNIS